MKAENQLGEILVTDESLLEFAPENSSEPLPEISNEAGAISLSDLAPTNTETISVHQMSDAELEAEMRPEESDEDNATTDVETASNSTDLPQVGED
jgi:hypothetical protein